mmetsp:Transcript_18295/g.27092  ORF Transcript_18295/g.27092 Transcript_18295/m.27092 type:complete len:147 (-) Transcript_18295:161-601(-)
MATSVHDDDDEEADSEPSGSQQGAEDEASEGKEDEAKEEQEAEEKGGEVKGQAGPLLTAAEAAPAPSPHRPTTGLLRSGNGRCRTRSSRRRGSGSGHWGRTAVWRGIGRGWQLRRHLWMRECQLRQINWQQLRRQNGSSSSNSSIS